MIATAPDRRSVARSQLIKLLAERLVREALAENSGDGPHEPARMPLREVQLRQAERDLDR